MLFIFYFVFLGSTKTCSYVYTVASWMFNIFVGNKIIFVYIDFIPIDVSRYDWSSKIIGSCIHLR